MEIEDKTMQEDETKNEIPTPIKAIRAKCLDCCCDQRDEVKLCPAKDCPLWPFRMGKNPNRSKNMTDEQRLAAKERLAKARAAKKNA
jgi:hypothetical protein